MSTAPSAATMMLLHKRGTPAVLLPEFLKEVYVGQRTGLLHVSRGEAVGVSFRSVNGQIVSGSASDEKGRLGETMVRLGFLSHDELARALRIVNAQRRRLAPVLRELELVDTPALEQALAHHIREMLLTALLWEQAALLFEDQELPDVPAEDLTLHCSTPQLIRELVRSIPTPDLVRRGIGSLDRPLQAVANVPYRLERVTLTRADGYLLSHANGRTPARYILEGAPFPQADLERSLLSLLSTGVLSFGTPSRNAAQQLRS